MALVWQLSENSVKYEVRSAGNSVRLYTNGVFHSQYNPNLLFTGAIWDALSLPSIFTEILPKKILVLGVGGGTAIHQFNRLLPAKELTGVEINPVHLRIAKKYFGLHLPELTLLREDAVAYMKSHVRTYDFILDDIFLEGDNNPYKPIGETGEWLSLLCKRLSANGILVQNHLSNSDASASVNIHRKFLRKHFASGLRLNVPHYENGVLAFFKTRVSPREARARAKQIIRKSFELKETRKLRYSLTTIF